MNFFEDFALLFFLMLPLLLLFFDLLGFCTEGEVREPVSVFGVGIMFDLSDNLAVIFGCRCSRSAKWK